MSVSNVNIFEFHDENKANEWISWYNIQGQSDGVKLISYCLYEQGPHPAFLFQYILMMRPERLAQKLEMNSRNNNLNSLVTFPP